MSLPTRPPIATLIAENAPFTPEQREWLNGFFAGVLSLEFPIDRVQTLVILIPLPSPAPIRQAQYNRARRQRGLTAGTVVADGVARRSSGAKRLLVGAFASETLFETAGLDQQAPLGD